jgi:hypothetical protein
MTTFASAVARRESRVLIHARRAAIAIVCVYGVFFWWSIYRRIRQVLRIEVHASALVLSPGSDVGYDVITSGEVQNRIRLELVQGAHSEVLLEQRGALPRVKSLDPRVYRYTPTVLITPELLARFDAGPATLRVTGFGGQKLLHTPAPRVREMRVQVRR